MSTTVWSRGRRVWSGGPRNAPAPVPYRNRNGDEFCPWESAADPIAVKYQPGYPVEDPADKVIYRVVSIVLAPMDGWASAAFWQERWGLVRQEVMELARKGFLDAAIEHGTAAKRFRCLNEAAVLNSSVVKQARLTRAGVAKRPAPQAGRQPGARTWASGEEIR